MAVAAAVTIAASGLSRDANAASWHWRQLEKNVNAVVVSSNFVYALSTNPFDYVPGSGWKLKKYLTPTTWENVGGAAGRSLTVSEKNQLWLVAEDGVWQRVGTSWYSYPKNACETGGGNITIRQVDFDNSIAVGKDAAGTDHPYVVGSDGVLRWWNGGCWYKMPALPSGSIKDVAIFDEYNNENDSLPWVVNGSEAFYRWNGSSWTSITTGTGEGVSNWNAVIGSTGSTIWKINSAGSFSQDATWTFGAIKSLAAVSSGSNMVTRALVDANARGWVYWYA